MIAHEPRCSNVNSDEKFRAQSLQQLQYRAAYRVLCKNKMCGRPPQYSPAPCKLTFDILTLKVVSESRVTWATSVPILIFLGLSVLDLGPMYATDVRRASSLNAPSLGAGGIKMYTCR